ncbi:hypothetical protein [Modestobacter excelsi]|uniref:hypothetical protein n=1 Tax=Modestobacter excelsi TaxID=2213161 RepID=UPI001C20D90E|nr:hypothetical protein [Modestobacter excelsi]
MVGNAAVAASLAGASVAGPALAGRPPALGNSAMAASASSSQRRPGGRPAATAPRRAGPTVTASPQKAAERRAAGPAGPEAGAQGRGTAVPVAQAPETPAAASAGPDAREAIAPAVAAVRRRAGVAKRHVPAHTAVGSAQAAAIEPRTEQVRGAAVETVTGLDAAEPKAVGRDDFKARLRQAIREATPQPRTEDEAATVMKTGATTASQTLKGDLRAERDAAVGPMQAAARTDVPASAQPAPPKTDLHVQPAGPPPAAVPAGPVVPAPLPAQRLDYSADRAPTDTAMAQNDVTQDQLRKGNEPAFGSTIEARTTAEKHEAAAEGQYRAHEAGVQEKALARGEDALAGGLSQVHGRRGDQLGKVGDKQRAVAARDAARRQEVTNRIAGIKNETKGQVEAVLKQIDDQAPTIFAAGLTRAEAAYEAAFEDAKGGVGTWLTTWGSEWDEHITQALGTARAEYMHQVDLAIDEVATFVDKKLTEAKDCVAAGRRRVDDFVTGLEGDLRQVGDEAREAVSGDFDAMATQIDEHRDALVSKLADQYKESYERMSAREEELREANKSLWQRVYDATVGLVKKIIAFKDMLLGVLARAAGVVSDIIHDPIGFLGNLVSAVMLGLKNFMANIGTHLQKGLMDWIFGALSGAGLQLPKAFDLPGIVSLVLQFLGLTYANFRARAVKIVGESVVGALEGAAEVFKVLLTEGVGGLWRFIKEKVSDLKSMVLDAIFDFVKEKVLIAGVTWIISLLNPASAFFKACKAIYDIVKFFIERGSQIMELVTAIVDSVAAIVKGNIGAAAAWVEKALAKAIPVAIGFLANLLGIGDPSKPVKETMARAQTPVNKAIDWLIRGAVKLVKAAGSAIRGLFGSKDKKKRTNHENDPQKAAKIDAGLIALNRAIAAREKDGKLAKAEADEIATDTRRTNPVFSSLSVHDAADSWQFFYSASPDEPGPKAPKAVEDPKIPRRHAKGVGEEKLYGEQGSSLRNGPEIHHLEAEHILPFRIGAMLWEELGLPEIKRKGRVDKEQATIMLYRGAAKAKTYKSSAGLFKAHADGPLIRRLKCVLDRARKKEGAAPAKLKGTAADAPLTMTGAQVVERARIANTLEVVRGHAVVRTNQAVHEDYGAKSEGIALTHAERRGIPPGELLPTPDAVAKASKDQLADVKGMAVEAVDEVLAERRKGAG